MKRPSFVGALVLAVAAGPSCRGIESDLHTLVEATKAQAGQQDFHSPAVELADSGPAPLVRVLHEGFQPERARELVAFIDQYYRAPANDGYEAVLERLESELGALGFGGSDARLVLDTLEGEEVAAWTPLSGKIVLAVQGEAARTLHAFSRGDEVDRVMLPVNAPSCALSGEVALALDDVKQGSILVTDVTADQVMTRARSRGAAAILSASLYPFNLDRSDKQRHLEAIQYRTLPPGTDLPVFQISAKSKATIEAALERAQKRGSTVRLELASEVRIERRPLRTMMAMIQGTGRAEEAVAMVSHVQEPGACDNASGVAGLLEGVRALVGALQQKKLAWPERSLVFLWGDEFSQSSSWLEATDLRPVVGISSDMTGQSRKETGALPLLERNYDPGALKVYEPDFHTPWGAGQVDPEAIVPNGLAVIARCAMADVSMLWDGAWETAEHPWEGGSDHDVFIRRGIPAVLFWHFTDFTYHTSLDRMTYLEPEEMRRTGVALLATGLAVASARPGDLDRYLRSLDREIELRTSVARERGDEEQAARWEAWSTGARGWLIDLCRGSAEPLPGSHPQSR